MNWLDDFGLTWY